MARLSSFQDELRRASRVRRELRNWFWLGPAVAAVLPSRWPPRAGMLGSWLGRLPVTVRLRDGETIRCRLEECEGVWAVFCERSYEPPGLDWFSVDSVVDVGANVGAATVWFAARAPHARIIAIEPNPSSRRWLIENVRRNGLERRVTVIPAALGSRRGWAALEPGPYSVETRVITEGIGERVPVLTLDEVLESADLTVVDVLKLDCEGAEYDMLADAPADRLARLRWIVGEYHPVLGRSPRELRDRLCAAGFHVTLDDGVDQGLFWASHHGQGSHGFKP